MNDIDKLKALIKATSDLVIEIIKDTKDGKLTLPEIVGLMPEAFALAKQIPNFKEVIQEVKDFDSEDAKELIEYIKVSEDLGDTDAAIILENLLDIYVKGVDIYEDNIIPIINVFK